MPKTRLDYVAKGLAKEIANATAAEQRAIGLAVARLAVERTGLEEPIVNSALRLLSNGIYEDKDTVAVLSQRVDDLDRQYLEAHERHEAGTEGEEIYSALFSRFTAASSVLCGFRNDPFAAAAEAVYEAGAAIGLGDVESLVKVTLTKRRSG